MKQAPSAPGSARALQVVAAQRREVELGGGHDQLAARCPAAPEPALRGIDDRQRQRLEFPGGADARMTAQNALDQRAARSRQTQNEDRRIGCIGCIGCIGRGGRQRYGRHGLDDPVDRRDILGHVVAQMRAPYARAALQAFKGPRVLPQVLELLGERIVQLHRGAPLEVRLRREALERGDVIAFRRLDTQLRSVAPRLVVRRAQRDDAVVVGFGLLELS